MRNNELAGNAQTVLGPIDAESLDVTLPHEHLLINARCTLLSRPRLVKLD